MSQEQYDEIKNILNRLEILENEFKSKNEELIVLNEEINKLKKHLHDIDIEIAPMIEHMDVWDKRDFYIYRTKKIINKYIYSPIHMGFRTILVITMKLLLTLVTGIIAGILLNVLGVGNLVKNLIHFFGSLF